MSFYGLLLIAELIIFVYSTKSWSRPNFFWVGTGTCTKDAHRSIVMCKSGQNPCKSRDCRLEPRFRTSVKFYGRPPSSTLSHKYTCNAYVMASGSCQGRGIAGRQHLRARTSRRNMFVASLFMINNFCYRSLFDFSDRPHFCRKNKVRYAKQI